jgi:hypothetical protein
VPFRALRDLWGCVSFLAIAACAVPPAKTPDPHYTEAGFFDLYYCNWSDRPRFFKVVFTSTRFADVQSVEVFDPLGRPFASVDLDDFGVMKRKRPDDPEKRGYFQDRPVKGDELPGWYTARITMTDGRVIEARDRVELRAPEYPANLRAEHRDGATVLRWDAPAGTVRYKVYVRDPWQDNRIVLESPLLARPEFEIAPGALAPGATYTWRVHARDAHEDPELGDFNAASMSTRSEVSVAGSNR